MHGGPDALTAPVNFGHLVAFPNDILLDQRKSATAAHLVYVQHSDAALDLLQR